MSRSRTPTPTLTGRYGALDAHRVRDHHDHASHSGSLTNLALDSATVALPNQTFGDLLSDDAHFGIEWSTVRVSLEVQP